MLADFFHRFRNPKVREELEAFRIEYEAMFGATDLTKRWTSTLSADQQEWLIGNFPKRYWDGLPEFLQAFLKQRMQAAQREGRLDDMPSYLLTLYFNDQMDIGGER